MGVIPSTHYFKNVSTMLVLNSGPNMWNSSGRPYKLVAVNGGGDSWKKDPLRKIVVKPSMARDAQNNQIVRVCGMRYGVTEPPTSFKSMELNEYKISCFGRYTDV